MAQNTDVRVATTNPTSATGGAANGSAVYIGDMSPSSVVFQVAGTYTSTMQYQTSVDGINWVQCGADVAGTGVVLNQTNMSTAGSNPRSSALWARLHCSVFTSITAVTFTASGVPLNG